MRLVYLYPPASEARAGRTQRLIRRLRERLAKEFEVKDWKQPEGRLAPDDVLVWLIHRDPAQCPSREVWNSQSRGGKLLLVLVAGTWEKVPEHLRNCVYTDLAGCDFDQQYRNLAQRVNGPNPETLDWLTIQRREAQEVRRGRARRGRTKGDPTCDATGLALSGGGIRSATFALGVLEELKQRGLLPQFDYLSTVSGGGYMGAWLLAGCRRNSSWIEREDRTECRQEEWAAAVGHLRDRSHYLSPHVGTLAPDVWDLVSTFVRNWLLTLFLICVLLSALAFLVLTAGFRLWIWLQTWPAVALALAAATFVVSVGFLGYQIRMVDEEPVSGESRRSPRAPLNSTSVFVFFALPALLNCILLSCALRGWMHLSPAQAAFYVAVLALPFLFSLCRESAKREPAGWLRVVVASLAGAVAQWGAIATASYCTRAFPGPGGFLLSSAVLMAGVWLTDAALTGFLGWTQSDIRREFRGRAHAMLLMLGGGLLAAWSLVLLGPWAVHWAMIQVGAFTGPAMLGLVAVASLLALRVRMAGVATVAAHMLVGLVCVVCAGAVQILLMGGAPPLELAAHLRALAALDVATMALTGAALGTLLVLCYFCFDINDIAFNNYYRNRLAACYLGATNLHRGEPGFLDARRDDLPLSSLSGNGYVGPFPIINTTLNLTGSQTLALKSRRAASFFFTSLHCGSLPPGAEIPTGDFAGTRQISAYRPISLARPMAISGAAVSPNSGALTTYPFALTALNARLGWWMRKPSSLRGPASDGARMGGASLWYLLSELLGSAPVQDSDYVYLSDGGHFDNLGLYELFRRRCRVIVVSDAEEDPELSCGGLAQSLRLAEVDFGVRVDIDLSALRLSSQRETKAHCAVGEIIYPERDGLPHGFGYLVYLKLSCTGDEPAPLQSYRQQSPRFPHEPTTDQFFSETQFESYRALGRHAAEKTFAPADAPMLYQVAEDLFWFWRGAAPAPEAPHLTSRLTELWNRLASESTLATLVPQLHPGWRQARPSRASDVIIPQPDDQFQSCLLFCSALLQLMDDAYSELKLEDYYKHPANVAWINLFRGWAQSPMLQLTWALTFQTYSYYFRLFAQRHLAWNDIVQRFELSADGRQLLLRLDGQHQPACLLCGSADFRRDQLTCFSLEDRYRFTGVADVYREKLRQRGVTQVDLDAIVPSAKRLHLTPGDFAAWWTYLPSMHGANTLKSDNPK